VTGFLGPNGAGKSTTMRMIVGLDRPTSGAALVDGRPYADHPAPLCVVGALLDAKSVHKGRTARSHLVGLADTHGFPARRVDEVLEQVGLTAVADRRAGGFSLGMSQRLGIAAALLGDPSAVVLDEPVNGLDPDGVLWIRTLLKELAAEGRTVLVSSHLMSEMAVTAEHLVITVTRAAGAFGGTEPPCRGGLDEITYGGGPMRRPADRDRGAGADDTNGR
jgi:ABC-2 type transport system ATP-binding protein